MSAQAWFNRIWYERVAPPWWLVPMSLAYGAVSGARRYLYAKRLRGSTRIARPVVIVGNLTVGGTGKTPLVCWLVAQLGERGFRPGIVTRGYGGSSGSVRLIEASDDPRRVGDEPILLAQRTCVPVAVGRDRPAAAQLLVGAGCDVIVSDDGWLLPAGPLRETRSRLSVANAIVVNGGRALLEGALSMRLEAKTAVALSGGRIVPLKDFAGTQVHAVAGIGNPERFFNMLRAHGIGVLGHPLADHARLTPRDIQFADEKPVLMTEKDAVKCRTAADARHWYVPVSASFEGGEANALLDIVTDRIAAREPRAKPRGTPDG
jgi:tetraacyldisaccharide 4'-kinase